jgi:23S rRNA (pseudouridine1915-N3)-methyltransferase
LQRCRLGGSLLESSARCRRYKRMKIRFVMLGKTRREGIRALLDDYISRISHFAEIEVSELRDATPAAIRKLKIEPGATVVLLDADGKQFTSQQFARWLGDLRDRGVRDLVFLCGDAEGFPAELRTSARQKISLSTLTMPHEFARVVLAEQIYRAFAILAGHPYPK